MTHGVLLMAYGTPERTEDLEAYYTDIRRGRPPTPEQLDDLRARYEAIGGLSPLAAITRAQARGLQTELGDGWRVALGMKHASPSIEGAAASLVDAGVDDIVGLVLAPHYSVLSVGQYHERAAAAIPASVAYTAIGPWGDEPQLISVLADSTRAAVDKLGTGSKVEVLVTAHSLPERALTLDDPSYPAQLQRTADLLAAKAALASHRIAWQSAGRTPEPWLGPDVLTVLRGLPDEGFDAAVVCPAGFTADHLEVLYDIDIEARRVANEVGLELARTPSLNTDVAFVSLLATLVRDTRL